MMLVLACTSCRLSSFYIRSSSYADAVIEPMFYWLNLYIGLHKLKVFDIGGGASIEFVCL